MAFHFKIFYFILLMTKTKSQRLRAKMMQKKVVVLTSRKNPKTNKKKKIKNKQKVSIASAYSSGSFRASRSKVSNGTYVRSAQTPHITHIPMRSELIGTVTSSVDGAISYFNINPGLPASFPWLSNIARNYELYCFKSLSYEYRTTSGEVISGNNPALGKAVIVTNYDVDDSPITDVIDLQNYEGSVSFPPYQQRAIHVVDVAGRKNGQVLPYTRRYVRTTQLSADVLTVSGGSPDPHAYDLGVLYIATAGNPDDGNVVGEIWVNYSVDLIKPKANRSEFVSQAGSWIGSSSSATTSGTDLPITLTNTLPGSNVIASSNNTQTLTFSTAIGRKYVLRVRVDRIGSSTNVNAAGSLVATFTGATVVTQYLTYGFGNLLNPGSTTTRMCNDWWLTADSGTWQATFTTPGTVGSSLPYVCQWNVNVYAVGDMPPMDSAKKPFGVYSQSTIPRTISDLQNRLRELELRTEEKEEKEDSYSVISDLARNREFRTPSSTRESSPSKRF